MKYPNKDNIRNCRSVSVNMSKIVIDAVEKASAYEGYSSRSEAVIEAIRGHLARCQKLVEIIQDA